MIEIKNISKKLGNTLAVNHFSMDFKEGFQELLEKTEQENPPCLD